MLPASPAGSAVESGFVMTGMVLVAFAEVLEEVMLAEEEGARVVELALALDEMAEEDGATVEEGIADSDEEGGGASEEDEGGGGGGASLLVGVGSGSGEGVGVGLGSSFEGEGEGAGASPPPPPLPPENSQDIWKRPTL